MINREDEFLADFQALNSDEARNGPEPLRWQTRLFQKLCANEVPKVCGLPTGMGKTSIIHLWMLALRHQIIEKQPRLPTRLDDCSVDTYTM
jgi:CRISPR/Cas system-associated endonuclease/helicase Cas3